MLNECIRALTSEIFCEANGRVASFHNDKEPLASSPYIVAASLDGGDRTSARIFLAARIPETELLKTLGPQGADVLVTSQASYFAPSDGSVRAKRVTRLGALELNAVPLPAPPADVVQGFLLAEVRRRGLTWLLAGDERAQQLVARVRFLASLDASWPDFGEEALMKTGEEWLGPALAAAGSLKGLKTPVPAGAQGPLEGLLLVSFLSVEQQRLLDRYAPTSLQTPAGTLAKVCYALEPVVSDGAQECEGIAVGTRGTSPGGKAGSQGQGPTAPVLESKLQEWFGATESPCVGPFGQVRVKLSLLSPAGRQVALTQDLPFFWQNGYVSIRAELRARYSKHPWPSDPLAASPTRETNKALQAAAQEGQESGVGTGDSNKGKRKEKRRK
jgi:ATP-dependent helicase HrpB